MPDDGVILGQRTKGEGEGGREVDILEALMPSTSLSETLRSTVFKPSFTDSVADFWAAKLVLNCRGA